MKNERNTKQKEKLILYLKQNENKHLTIQQIQEDLKNELGLTTIYRIMKCLLDKGEIIKIPLENKQGFCYQYNEKQKECKHHYHLICESCGKLIHFESKGISSIIKDAKKNDDFMINHEKIVFLR